MTITIILKVNKMYESETGYIWSAREVLEGIADDFRENYISTQHYAECNGLYPEQAQKLIALAQSVRDSKHPEA